MAARSIKLRQSSHNLAGDKTMPPVEQATSAPSYEASDIAASPQSEDNYSDVDWDEWERAGFFIPDSYRTARAPAIESPDPGSQANSPMVLASWKSSAEESDPAACAPARSEAEIIDEAFEFALEFLSKRPRETSSPTARARSTTPDPTDGNWLSAADKVFGIYELCERIMSHLRSDHILQARGINKKVRATIHTSKPLREGLFLEPVPDADQRFWCHTPAVCKFVSMKREEVAKHATWVLSEELLLPRAIKPYIIGRYSGLGSRCERGHLRCEYAQLASSIPRGNHGFRTFMHGDPNRLNTSPLDLTSPGCKDVGFTSIRFPRFNGNEPSFLDDMLLTQPASYAVVISYLALPTCGGTNAIFVNRRIDNPVGVRVSDVRRAVEAEGHGTAELSSDVGLMIMDCEGTVVLPSLHQWREARVFCGLFCQEKDETAWDMRDLRSALLGWT